MPSSSASLSSYEIEVVDGPKEMTPSFDSLSPPPPPIGRPPQRQVHSSRNSPELSQIHESDSTCCGPSRVFSLSPKQNDSTDFFRGDGTKKLIERLEKKFGVGQKRKYSRDRRKNSGRRIRHGGKRICDRDRRRRSIFSSSSSAGSTSDRDANFGEIFGKKRKRCEKNEKKLKSKHLGKVRKSVDEFDQGSRDQRGSQESRNAREPQGSQGSQRPPIVRRSFQVPAFQQQPLIYAQPISVHFQPQPPPIAYCDAGADFGQPLMGLAAPFVASNYSSDGGEMARLRSRLHNGQQEELTKLKKEKDDLMKKLFELTEKANEDLWRLKKELAKERKNREQLEAKNAKLEFDVKKFTLDMAHLQKKLDEKRQQAKHKVEMESLKRSKCEAEFNEIRAEFPEIKKIF